MTVSPNGAGMGAGNAHQMNGNIGSSGRGSSSSGGGNEHTGGAGASAGAGGAGGGEKGVVGLMNEGNWCYLNASLQVLARCAPFRAHLVECVPSPDIAGRPW